MEEFKAIHGDLYNLQSFCGFWPLPEPQNIFLHRIKRVVINSITIACIVIQYSTLRNVELTLDNVLSTVSFSCPMILFFIRYMAYLFAFKTMGEIFQNIANDFVEWKNTEEMKVIEEEIAQAKLIYYYYIRIVSCTVVGLYLAFIPIITQPKHQVAYLRYFGFYFIEQSIQTTLVCFQIMFVYGVGIFCVLGTESSLSVITHHVCGLLKVTWMMDACSHNLGLSYLVTIGTACVSFSLNLFRMFLMISQGNLDEAVAPFLIIIAHVIMLFLGNHCGQRVSNTSLHIFNAAYSSEWYNIPLHERKLINFIMMKSSKELMFSMLSLYIANYEGYSMVIRTAFSYFTVLLSVQ